MSSLKTAAMPFVEELLQHTGNHATIDDSHNQHYGTMIAQVGEGRVSSGLLASVALNAQAVMRRLDMRWQSPQQHVVVEIRV